MTVRAAGELSIMTHHGNGPLAAAPADAPVFLVVPTLPHAPEALWLLVAELERDGISPTVVSEIRDTAQAMEAWQRANPNLISRLGRGAFP